MFYSTRLERLAREKHFSLMGPFVSYKEKEVLLRPLLPLCTWRQWRICKVYSRFRSKLRQCKRSFRSGLSRRKNRQSLVWSGGQKTFLIIFQKQNLKRNSFVYFFSNCVSQPQRSNKYRSLMLRLGRSMYVISVDEKNSSKGLSLLKNALDI